MPYIAPSTKHARLWVDAVSKSLKIEKSDAATMYARLCDFKSWDQLVQAIGRGKPFYCDVLVDEFGMNTRFAEYIIEMASPSSGKKPSRFSLDTGGMHTPDEDDKPSIGKLFQEMGLDSEEGMDKAAEEFFRRTMGDSLPEDFSFENFTGRMRISKPIDPGAWWDLLMTIGWDLIEDSFRPEYVYGEESFVAVHDDEEIPVFVTSLVRVPFDDDDEMANEVMAVVEEHADYELESDKILLFWGQPTIKEINGKPYGHYGMYYVDGQWHEFLLNKDTTITEVFNQHLIMESVESPHVSLSDEGYGLAAAMAKVLNGIEPDADVPMSTLGSPSGWKSLLPS